MGVLKRIGYHIFYNGFGTQSQGAKLARDAVKGVGIDHPIGEIGAVAIGAFAGSILGGIRMLSPDAILESVTKTEEELEDRIDKMGPWGGLD